MKRLNFKDHWKDYLQAIAPIIGVIAVIIIFEIVTKGKLLTSKNLVVLVNQIYYVLLISLGAIFVYSHGNMDISIGGMMGVAMLLGTLIVERTDNILLGIIVIMVFTTVMGIFNGFMQDNFRQLPFLPSLCMMFVFQGILTYAGNIRTYKIDNKYAIYDNTMLKVVVLVVGIVISYYLYNYTKIGKFNKAIGGNPVASEQLGVNLTKYRVIAFMLTGIFVGVAAFFSMVRTRAVTASAGSGMEFDVMTALIFGGMTLAGGSRSRFKAAICGAVTFTVLSNGLTMSGFSVGMVALIKAIIFFVLVALSTDRTKGALPRH